MEFGFIWYDPIQIQSVSFHVFLLETPDLHLVIDCKPTYPRKKNSAPGGKYLSGVWLGEDPEETP